MFFRVITFFSIIFHLVFCAIALKPGAENVSENIDKIYLNENNQKKNQFAESAFSQRKWVSQLFHQAQLEFQMNSNVNVECKRDFDLFKLHLQNQSVWAVKMLESSEWPLDGILSGKVDRFGNYDECLTISSYGIKGQYCLTEVIYDYPVTLQHEIAEVPDETISAWKVLSMYQRNPIRMERNKQKFAICIPSSCTTDDLKISLNSTLSPIFKIQELNITVAVKSEFCKVQKDTIYPPGFYIVGYSLVALFLFIICCTFYDISTSTEDETKNIGNPRDNSSRDIFQMFSISRNFQKLTKINPKTDYAAVDFAKIFHMVAMIYSHRLVFSFSNPLFNSEVAERYYMGFSFEFTHQYIMVDVFFFISGFLKFHFDLSPTMKEGKFYLFSSIMLRWIRMVPVACVIIFFITYILPYLGDGPMWNHIMMREIVNCKETWWTNLLVINNIIEPDKQCLIIFWYMVIDIQLAILGGILLYIFVKNKKIGIFAVIFSFLLSIVVTFMVAYINHYDGLLKFTLRALENIRTYGEFSNFYVALYPRCGPYLMGFMSAYVIKKLQEKKIKFTNKQVYLLLLAALTVTETNQFYGGVFYAFNRPYHRFEGALYAALNRSISMVIYVALCILYFTSGLGIFNKIIEMKIWVPFGRLTYSVFLINAMLQVYHISSQKQPVLPSRINMLWWTFADVTLSYIFGLLLYLFVEAPIMNLRILVKKHLFSGTSKVPGPPAGEWGFGDFSKKTDADGGENLKMNTEACQYSGGCLQNKNGTWIQYSRSVLLQRIENDL